jgi:hypothetical protein
MGMTVWDIYALEHPDAGPCPQPHRLRFFTYAMALVADEIEAKKFGIHPDQQEGSGAKSRAGTEIRMPGGSIGFKPGVSREG